MANRIATDGERGGVFCGCCQEGVIMNEPLSEPLWSCGASALAEGIRSKQVSSREVIEAHLGRIDAVNGTLRAISVVLADSALASADAADAALARGEEVGALHGVPMTVKENIDLTGSATTQGIVAMEKAEPALDAPHIAQLKRAGAIPIGRTNMPDFGLRWHTDNDLRGPTRNPWSAGHTPGGSSGGDGAALAAGMTPLGNGNDYGGSVRLPSQFCGTTGLRVTLGRVPQHGSLNPRDPGPTLQLFAVQGPMARHVGDLRVALASMSGADPRDPWWTPAPLEGAPVARPIRVAVVTRPEGGDVDPRVVEGVRRAADALSDAGYAVEEAEPPGVEEAALLWKKLVNAELAGTMLPLMRPLVSDDAKLFLDALVGDNAELSLAEYAAAWSDRLALARRWAEFLAERPLILGPVCTRPAFAVGADITSRESANEVARSMRFVTPINLLGLPAVAVPVGVADGLPQGVQLIGDRYREDLCLDAAEAIEVRVGRITPIDPV